MKRREMVTSKDFFFLFFGCWFLVVVLRAVRALWWQVHERSDDRHRPFCDGGGVRKTADLRMFGGRGPEKEGAQGKEQCDPS